MSFDLNPNPTQSLFPTPRWSAPGIRDFSEGALHDVLGCERESVWTIMRIDSAQDPLMRELDVGGVCPHAQTQRCQMTECMAY